MAQFWQVRWWCPARLDHTATLVIAKFARGSATRTFHAVLGGSDEHAGVTAAQTLQLFDV
eukprot:3567310-Amphidinium_carterae.2